MNLSSHLVEATTVSAPPEIGFLLYLLIFIIPCVLLMLLTEAE